MHCEINLHKGSHFAGTVSKTNYGRVGPDASSEFEDLFVASKDHVFKGCKIDSRVSENPSPLEIQGKFVAWDP